MPRLAPCLATLLGLAVLPAATAGDPARTGALSTPANRIVGTWSNVATVGPCGGQAAEPQRQTIQFHAGGTFTDNPRFPPQGLPNLAGIAGVHQRSIGLGDWRYDPASGQYTLSQRFDWYVNNAYHGYQVVERTIVLSNDRNTASGPVRTVRYAANGAILAQLCGQAVSTRI